MSEYSATFDFDFGELHQLIHGQLHDQLTAAEHARLEHLVCDSPTARRAYVAYIVDTARLRRRAMALALGASAPILPRIALAVHEAFSDAGQSLRRINPRWIALGVAGAVVQALIIFMLTLPSVNPSGGDMAQDATAFVHDLDHSMATADTPANSANELPATGAGPAEDVPRGAIVAWLAKVSEAKWSGEFLPKVGERIAAGDQLELTAGYAEVEFLSGARVVLQGPALWAAESPLGNRLHFGRLTAHVPPSASGFTLEMPQGRVVDYGTEFGAYVGRDGQSSVFVFNGEVEAVWSQNASGGTSPDAGTAPTLRQRLTAGQSAGYGRTGEPVEVQAAFARKFMRWVPQDKSFPLFATGRSQPEGGIEPLWQIRHESQPDDSWQAAVVARANELWVPNSQHLSQWISASGDGHDHHLTGRWIFRTQFDLSDYDHATARIIGRFAVDNELEQIYVNGHPLFDAPPATTYADFIPFTIDRKFLAEVNTVDFVVVNDGELANPMGLRVEWSGFADLVPGRNPDRFQGGTSSESGVTPLN